jgi:hypothetical protein
MVTDYAGVRVEVLRLPGVANEFNPLAIERFTNTVPRDLCHTLPLEKLQA